MIYTLRHRTTYRYGKPVRFARCALRLKPQDGEGQSVLASAVTIDPSPTNAVMRRDYFGIEAVAITLDTPHTTFSVEALSTVRVERRVPPEPESGQAWERVRDAVVASRDLGGRAPVHFLFPSGRVPLVPDVTEYARASFAPGRSAYGAAHDLMLRIGADFRFDAKATNVRTPLAESFALRAGVCQDFAHVMIAGLRGMGLPAAYVSGYLRTVPPPAGRGCAGRMRATPGWRSGAARLARPRPDQRRAGAGRPHRGGPRRDYGDVAPVDGIVSGSGKQRLKVEVDVIPETETQDLAWWVKPRPAVRPRRDGAVSGCPLRLDVPRSGLHLFPGTEAMHRWSRHRSQGPERRMPAGGGLRRCRSGCRIRAAVSRGCRRQSLLVAAADASDPELNALLDAALADLDDPAET